MDPVKNGTPGKMPREANAALAAAVTTTGASVSSTPPILQQVSLAASRDYPQLKASTSDQRMREPKKAVEEDIQGLEEFKKFFNSWQFPSQCQHLQKAIFELVRGFERTLLEQRTALEAKPTHSYETDEDEVAMETDWVTAKKKKKKKSTPQCKTNPDGGTRKPPPIKIESNAVKVITSLAAQATNGEENFAVKTLNNKVVKVNFEEESGYRNMVSALKENNAAFYTYENKQTRPIRVVAKGLSHQWEEKDIYENLKATGYKINNVSRRLSAKDKSPLNMFTLSFDHEENIDSIYKINKILHNVVEICPLKGGKFVPQCKNCQEYGHTKNHCNKKPRCVKCGLDHLTVTCNKLPQARPCCANCQGDHPANYRGCIVAKEAQALRKQQRKAKQPIRNPQGKPRQVQNPSVQRPAMGSINNPPLQRPWNQVVKSGKTAPPQPKVQDSDTTLALILNEIKGLRAEITLLTRRVEVIEQRPISGYQHRNK